MVWKGFPMKYKSLPRGPKPAVALQSANAAGAAALQAAGVARPERERSGARTARERNLNGAERQRAEWSATEQERNTAASRKLPKAKRAFGKVQNTRHPAPTPRSLLLCLILWGRSSEKTKATMIDTQACAIVSNPPSPASAESLPAATHCC